MKFISILFKFFLLSLISFGQIQVPFPSTPLTVTDDLSSLMVQGIERFLIRETVNVRNERTGLWKINFSNPELFNNSIIFQRNLLAQRLGVVDNRTAPAMEVLTNSRLHQYRVEDRACVIRAVRWAVLEELWAEGLLLQPKGNIIARVVIIPDADILPEVLAGLYKTGGILNEVARQLAGEGCEILIPVLVSRDDTFSGNTLAGRFTNQPHREWIYRQAYEVGRHIIGYELQKIFAAIDWMELQNKTDEKDVPIGIAGYGEGGLLALYAAAFDQRISSTLVSGYFNNREKLWNEPIYRNVFGLMKYFGDAELAVMSWPRRLVVEHAFAPEVSGPPAPSKGRSGAAPGKLTTPDFSTAQAEINRVKALLPSDNIHVHWLHGKDSSALKPFSPESINVFVKGLNINIPVEVTNKVFSPFDTVDWPDFTMRQERTVRSIEQHVQRVLSLCERTRDQNFWQTLKGGTAYQKAAKKAHRERMWEIIGRLPTPTMPANPKSRQLQKTENWTGYEITLDVWPGVFAWGILLIPTDIRPGEKRPVIVCQHGLEGLPADVVTTDPEADGFRAYQGFAARLADLGYVVFAPHNPYRGGDKFRVLQRRANPLGLSLFSVITGQHQRILEWLGQLSFTDPSKIGFYGLSYGGKTAMRVPALLEGYALSICSGDFNEWVRKNASTEYPFTYMFTGEYEIFEWDLGHSFNYAEMAGLIAPRPFMVERGHNDGVAIDEWVAYEFAKVRRHYDFLELQGSCRIEYFNGPHMIHGVGTFEFLDRHLHWGSRSLMKYPARPKQIH